MGIACLVLFLSNEALFRFQVVSWNDFQPVLVLKQPY